MKCEQIQELILTDYLDGRLEGNTSVEIEHHLKDCVACREFAASVRQTAEEPFKDAEDAPLSLEGVWDRIQEEIQQAEEPQVRSGWMDRFADGLRQWVWRPRPRPALAMAAVVILLVAGLFYFKQAQIARSPSGNGEIIYLSSMMEALTSISETESKGYGTDIEYYFL